MLRQAFAAGLLQAGQIWIDMHDQSNLMAHTYVIKRARIALALIAATYAPAIAALTKDLDHPP